MKMTDIPHQIVDVKLGHAQLDEFGVTPVVNDGLVAGDDDSLHLNEVETVKDHFGKFQREQAHSAGCGSSRTFANNMEMGNICLNK